MIIDRTSQLFAQAQQFEHHMRNSNQIRGLDPAIEANKAALKQQNAPFAQGSAYVTKEIEELHKSVLFFNKDAQKRTLFEENAEKLARGSDAIKRNMQKVSKAMESLQTIVERNQTDQHKKHCKTILETLRKRFTTIGKSFQECLQERTRVLNERGKKQNDIFGASRVNFAPVVSQAPAPAAIPATNVHHPPQNNNDTGYAPMATNQQLPQPIGIRRRGPVGPGGFAPPSPTRHGESPMAFNPGFMASSTGGSDREATRQVQYDRSSFDQKRRAMEVQNIESMVSEVSQMFTKMAHMVNEQREDVEFIDNNVDESLEHVTAAQSELMKYYSNLTGDRALILKLFAVVIFIAIFFIVMW